MRRARTAVHQQQPAAGVRRQSRGAGAAGCPRARAVPACSRARAACDCAGANAASPQSVRMRGILTPALRSGGTPCLSSGGLLLLLCLRPPAIVDLRRQVQEALCGLEALIVPCRRSSAYFPHCQHRDAGSAGIGWEPATLGNAGSARWWRAPAHMRGACVHNERRAAVLSSQGDPKCENACTL